jgi:hypothetical protein
MSKKNRAGNFDNFVKNFGQNFTKLRNLEQAFMILKLIKNALNRYRQL